MCDLPFKRKDDDEPDGDDPERVGEEEERLTTPVTENERHPDARTSDPRQPLVEPIQQDEEEHASVRHTDGAEVHASRQLPDGSPLEDAQ